MKSFVQIGLIAMIVILSGCADGEIQPRPETPAFQDDFTREFMDSIEEVQEGFYRFKSKTEGYTMLFPVNATVDPVSYGKSQDIYEGYSFGEQIKEKKLSYSYQIIYENKPITNNIDIKLKSLSSYASYDGDYKEFESNGKTYYYAKGVFATEVREHYSFFSYIKSNKSDKAVSYSASSTCLNQDKSCEANTKEIEERFLMLMKSVDFLE